MKKWKVLFLVASMVFMGLFVVQAEEPPKIGVNRTNLNFGAIKGGPDMTSSSTPSQSLLISNTGGGTLNWEITTDGDWLICSPKTGTGTGTVNVSVAPCLLPPGSYNGSITFRDWMNPAVTPQTVPVNLEVKNPPQDQPPFGTFATPIHNSSVSSSIPVTGWVLDDVEVDNVKIYNGSDYVGDAVFVEGARPDVEQANPYTPLNYRSGWGYMMLTNFLPGGGNGTYYITAVATDSEDNKTTLGTKTIVCDNANAVKPFGAIDTPTQGGPASGSGYINWGWALTPQPNHIPNDGSTINVWVDGVNRGHVNQYNIYRQDLANLFPDYANSDGAVGYFYLDTTGYADGVYTIQWTAEDNAHNADGIGSRYFTINNTGNERKANTASQYRRMPPLNGRSINDLSMDQISPVTVKNGFGENNPSREIYPDDQGIIRIEMRELGRIELDLSTNGEISGYMVVGEKLRSLPIGSTLDPRSGKFYWMPGPGFSGEYRLVFVETGQNGEMNRKDVFVKVLPKN